MEVISITPRGRMWINRNAFSSSSNHSERVQADPLKGTSESCWRTQRCIAILEGFGQNHTRFRRFPAGSGSESMTRLNRGDQCGESGQAVTVRATGGGSS